MLMESDDDMLYEDDSENSIEEDDEDFMDIGLEPEPSTTIEKQKGDEYQFDILTADEIVQHMDDCIQDVISVIQIPATTVRILLNHFKWDKQKLIECYYEANQDKLFSEAHVRSLSGGRGSARSSSSAETEAADLECEICLLTVPSQMMMGLECSHTFCVTCWTDYLTMKIMDEGMGQTIACAAHGCDILVDDATVMKLVTDADVKLKYQNLITNNFVECSHLLRWCPKPDCSHVVKVDYYDAAPVTCVCSHTFCFSCGENWHDPVKCKWLKMWIKKCDFDSETFHWMAANTKECRKCHSMIEKDGGCNKMVCKKCYFNFCWVCLGPWETHGSSWFSCNRYDKEDAKKAHDLRIEQLSDRLEIVRTSGLESPSDMQRYLFFRNRYVNHMQSLKFENKLYDRIRIKMGEFNQHNMFLKKAVDVLWQCRQMLMYTYVFAFYLKQNNQSIIFEDNQKYLEQATEELSEYLENAVTSDDALVDIKQNLIDKCTYCENRRKKALDHVYEGYEKDVWEYQDL